MAKTLNTSIDSCQSLLACLDTIGFFYNYEEKHRKKVVEYLQKRFREESEGPNAEHFRRFPGQLLAVDFYETDDDFMLGMLESLSAKSFGLFPAKEFNISFEDPCEFQFKIGRKTYATEFELAEVNWRILDFVTTVTSEINNGICPHSFFHSAFDEGTYLIFCHKRAFTKLQKSGLILTSLEEFQDANLPPWKF
ncbi:hypothetical protein RMSM_01505 [Rhodopirellula maiorica SM1]|uniref:Uncharacterized protein n=1 Tax=Rhodopirellula maiorica SM1 TaxID=1265738 RepID=M5S1N3_9BACT|nr:hypothetical protein [Rhodopirellula maiorica]EMI21567.1 hypothetical protein RMSM_01505 [Rhodopirellula maiorica SM1]